MNKKVLIISYYWPPAGGVSVQRVMYFAKYLQQNGWTPFILTVRNGNYSIIDDALLDEVSSVSSVYCAQTLEAHALFKNKPKKKQPSVPSFKPSNFKRAISKIADWVRLNVFIPDSRIGWYPAAVKRGKEIIKAHDIDVIFSSAPPYTPHLVAKKLSSDCKVKWVADFRDPWLDNTMYNTSHRFQFIRNITQKLEKTVLEKASAVTCTGWKLAEHYKSKVDSEHRAKFNVITNGYEPTLGAEKGSEVDLERFVITYFGSIYRHRYVPVLFSALGELAKANKDFGEKLLIRFVGEVDAYCRLNLEGVIPQANMQFTGFLPQNEARELLQQSALCLMTIDDVAFNDTIILGKLYDYIQLGTEVLGVGPLDGDSAEMLKRYGLGNMFDYGDETGIQEYTLSRFQAWEANDLGDRKIPPESLSREKLTEGLALVLDKVCAVGDY